MATQAQKERAAELRRILAGKLPSSLRAPLRAVQDGTEVPGTAEDVLSLATDVLLARCLEGLLAR